MLENTMDQFEEAGVTAVRQDEANLELGQVQGSGDYDRLIAQREELERRARQEREELEAKIQEARTRHLEGVVKEIQAKIAQFGLCPAMCFLNSISAASARSPRLRRNTAIRRLAQHGQVEARPRHGLGTRIASSLRFDGIAAPAMPGTKPGDCLLVFSIDVPFGKVF